MFPPFGMLILFTQCYVGWLRSKLANFNNPRQKQIHKVFLNFHCRTQDLYCFNLLVVSHSSPKFPTALKFLLTFCFKYTKTSRSNFTETNNL